MKKLFSLTLVLAFLLSGCGLPGRDAAPAPTPASEAAAAEPGAESAAEAAGTQAAVMEISDSFPASDLGLTVHMERTNREAFDPETGTRRILSFCWDTVRVESAENPDAARRMTEELAALEDAWYTGSGSSEGNIYGYSAMLEAAEDNYTMYREMGVEEIPVCFSSRTLTMLRADSELCVFLVNNYDYLGGAHGGYSFEALCFDARTGARLGLDAMSSAPEALRAALLNGMLRLAREDPNLAAQLDLTPPESLEPALAALLREGNWYAGEESFCVFSDLYELGSYASGPAWFNIPYDGLPLDSRWVPQVPVTTATLSLTPLTEGNVEIVDRVTTGEGGTPCLLRISGEATDLRISRFPDEECFFCGRIRDCALQLDLFAIGDTPDLELSYRDAAGLHSFQLVLSGENGSWLLVPET